MGFSSLINRVKDYYEILEIDRQATDADVKRAYRRLAMDLHPDTNPDAAAHQRFLEVAEAYKVLSDPVDRQRYNLLLDAQQSWHQANVIRRTAATSARYRQPSPSQPRRPVYRRRPSRQAEFARYRWVTVTICALGLLFASLLFADFSLRRTGLAETVINIELAQSEDLELRAWVSTDRQRFRVSHDRLDRLGHGDKISLERTPLFDRLVTIYVWETMPARGSKLPTIIRESAGKEPGIRDSFAPHSSIYNVFSFFPLLLGLSSLGGLALVIAGQLERGFQSALMSALTGIITLLLFLIT